MESSGINAVKAFITAINQGDVTKMSELMTDDHTFIDARGRAVSGRDVMIPGWKDYFGMFPDYKIEVETIFQQGNLVAAFGSARGTFNGKRGMVPENVIRMPAAWKAEVINGKIKLWQVFADWTEGVKIMEEDRKTG